VIGVPLMVSLTGAGAHTLWDTLDGRTADDVIAFHAAHRARVHASDPAEEIAR
jgi:hypothetical protein